MLSDRIVKSRHRLTDTDVDDEAAMNRLKNQNVSLYFRIK